MTFFIIIIKFFHHVEHILLKMGQNPQNGPKRAKKGVKKATEGKSGFRQQNHLLLKED